MNTQYNHQKFYIPLFFFPLSFIFGIVVTEVFVLLFLIFFFFNLSKADFFFDKKVIILFLFSLYVALNAMFQITDDLKYSSFLHFRYVLFSLAIFLLYEGLFDKNFNKKMLNIFLFILSFLLLDSFFQFISGVNLLGYKISSNRISSFFGDELILGSYLVRLLPIIIWYIYNLKINPKEKKFSYTFFFAAYFCVIYLSGERTSLALFLILFFFTFIFINNLRIIFLRSFVIFLAFVLSTIFFDFGKSDIKHRIFDKTYQQIFPEAKKNHTKDENELNNIKPSKILIFSQAHQGHYVLAKKLFLDNPVFGTGPKGFRHYCRIVKYDSKIGICSTHPHNIIAQILSELGLVGIIFLLIFLVFLIKRFFDVAFVKLKTNHHYAFLIASLGIFINLFPFLPSGNFFNNWISIIIYFNIGLYLVSDKKLMLK